MVAVQREVVERVMASAHQHQRDLGQPAVPMFEATPELNECSGVCVRVRVLPVKRIQRDVPFGRTVPV